MGPALGQAGVNIMDFCKAFNAKTAKDEGLIIPVVITVYADRSYTFITKTPPVAVLIKKEAGIAKGSGEPNKNKVGKITMKQVEDIAKLKLPGPHRSRSPGRDATGAGHRAQHGRGGSVIASHRALSRVDKIRRHEAGRFEDAPSQVSGASRQKNKWERRLGKVGAQRSARRGNGESRKEIQGGRESGRRRSRSTRCPRPWPR